MKISLNNLVAVKSDDVASFLAITNITPKEIEKYVGGQCSKISRLRANLYKAQEMGKIEKEEFEEIVSFCNENMAIIQKIVQNFDLFKNVGIPRNTYANFNSRVNNLLKK